jgi:hypothetical protein
MERLGFTENSGYQATEASYHIARYSIVRPFCAGRRVLDAACGEGYGSYLMASKWGAASVLGIDISEEAIVSARKNFSAENASYEVGSAYDLSRYAANGKFDLIVSLETIEHLQDPVAFLKQLKDVASDDASIIISCPNDPMLYGTDSVGNAFHLHRYTAEEFFGMVEGVLGKCAAKIIGTPIFGTGNFRVGSDCLDTGANQLSMLRGKLPFDGPVAQVPPDDLVNLEQATYYVGIWGSCPDEYIIDSVTFYPSHIKSAALDRLRQDVVMLSSQITDLKTQIWNLQQRDPADVAVINSMPAHISEEALRINVLTAENQLAREGVATLQDRLDATSPELAAVRTQLRQHVLRIQVLAAENLLARKNIAALQRGRASASMDPVVLQEKLDAVPWRVVSLYIHLRRLVPISFIHFAARIFDKVRELWNRR